MSVRRLIESLFNQKTLACRKTSVTRFIFVLPVKIAKEKNHKYLFTINILKNGIHTWNVTFIIKYKINIDTYTKDTFNCRKIFKRNVSAQKQMKY